MPTRTLCASRLAALKLLAACVALLVPSLACAADDVDLVGTWYVLVHYTDSDTAHAERQRWDDRIWVFEKKGSRLVWTEYPIVVFNDRSGRFEQTAHGQRRVTHAWEPNQGQRKQIQSGLEFNSRGTKKKTLRRQSDGSWASLAPAAALSASVVGYHETWTIGFDDGLPEFTRDDVLGSAQAEAMQGRTRYRAVRVDRDGAELRGYFTRDESRRGTFRMMRAGEVKSVGTKRSARERLRDAAGGGRQAWPGLERSAPAEPGEAGATDAEAADAPGPPPSPDAAGSSEGSPGGAASSDPPEGGSAPAPGEAR